MTHLDHSKMKIEAELQGPIATAQLIHIASEEPSEGPLGEDMFRLDLCLSPRPDDAVATFEGHWAPNRFERVGELFLLPAGMHLLARSSAGSFNAIVLRLHKTTVETLLEDTFEWTEQKLSEALDLQNARIRALMLRIADEIKTPRFGANLMIEALMGETVVEMARHCRFSENQPCESGKLSNWRLRQIDQRLLQSPSAPTLAELAKLCDLSVRQLARAFRASKGISIGDYVAQRQLEHAKRLLATDLNVKSIAHELGFKSVAGFCYAFRREAGETPGQFRRNRLQQVTLRLPH